MTGRLRISAMLPSLVLLTMPLACQPVQTNRPAIVTPADQTRQTICDHFGLRGLRDRKVKVAYAPKGNFAAADVSEVQVLQNTRLDITPLLVPLDMLLRALPAKGTATQNDFPLDTPQYRIQIAQAGKKTATLLFHNGHLQSPTGSFYTDAKAVDLERRLLAWTQEVLQMPADWNQAPLKAGAVKTIRDAEHAAWMKLAPGGIPDFLGTVAVFRRPFTGGDDAFAHRGDLLWVVIFGNMVSPGLDSTDSRLTQGLTFVWIVPASGASLLRLQEPFPVYHIRAASANPMIRWLRGPHTAPFP